MNKRCIKIRKSVHIEQWSHSSDRLCVRNTIYRLRPTFCCTLRGQRRLDWTDHIVLISCNFAICCAAIYCLLPMVFDRW